LKLKKRFCTINIELDPIGIDMIDISMDVCGKHYDFSASSAVGFQFGLFLSSLYCLYNESNHSEHRMYLSKGISLDTDHYTYVRTEFSWDSEGHITFFSLMRYCNVSEFPNYCENDIIELTIDEKEMFILKAQDLCYAVAKACTKALKRCGIYGYYLSSGANCNGYGDLLNIQHLLFVKAYALNATDIRCPVEIWRHPKHNYLSTDATPFEQEIEILLFDM